VNTKNQNKSSYVCKNQKKSMESYEWSSPKSLSWWSFTPV
jgi:lipopolysaccharide biosynthesis regulator YciM